MHVVRVCPEVAPAVITYAFRYELRVKHEKYSYDSHTLFSGSKSAIQRIMAFERGYIAALDAIEHKQT